MLPEKKKICFVISSVITAEAFLRNHFTFLSEDYEIYLAGNFSGADRDILYNLNIAGFYTVKIERNIHPWRDVKALFRLVRYFRKMKFFAVHSVTPKAGLIAAMAGLLAAIPNRIHIFTGQVWHTRHGAMKTLLKSLDRIIARLDTHLLVDGRSQRRYLIENGILRSSSSRVLGYGSISGVDTARFCPDEIKRRELRERLGIPDSKVVFMFLGRLNADKGIEELFSAFANLCEENKNVYLVLVGADEGNMLNGLKKYPVIKNGINFLFYGQAPNPHEILQAADVFCLPSRREGFGTSVIEASACCLPVICSDTYGLSDAVIDGVTGLVHRTGDAGSLYEKMKLLAGDEPLRKCLGRCGRQNVLNYFTSGKISGAWVSFYKELEYASRPQINKGYEQKPHAV